MLVNLQYSHEVLAVGPNQIAESWIGFIEYIAKTGPGYRDQSAKQTKACKNRGRIIFPPPRIV